MPRWSGLSCIGQRDACSTGAAQTCIASHHYVPAPNLSCHVVLPLILLPKDKALLFRHRSLSHWRTGVSHRGDCLVPITRKITTPFSGTNARRHCPVTQGQQKAGDHHMISLGPWSRRDGVESWKSKSTVPFNQEMSIYRTHIKFRAHPDCACSLQ